MDKNKILELLARKMAGEASQRELEELSELINRFPDAIYYEELLTQLWTKSADLESETPNMEKRYQLHRTKHASDFNRKKKIIGSVILAFAVSLLTVLYFNYNHTPGTSINIIAGNGVRKKITLPDGTLVWLNSNSKLSYSADLGNARHRVVFLRGEAYFDVAHHQTRPFLVRTKKLTVKVLGTAFNVKAYPNEKTAEATLIRGAIELSVFARPKQKIFLNPSEKFSLEECKQVHLLKSDKSQDPAALTLIIKQVKPMVIGNHQYIREVAWKDSLLVFKDESLEELKPKLERWYDLKITVGQSVPESYRFTGILKNENIKEALTAMQLIKPFKFKLIANELTIY